jgi:hypothetical protein
MKKYQERSGGKKWFIGVVLVIILITAVTVICVISRLDFMVKAAIEKYGSMATGTPVRVESVKIRLRQGSGDIHGLTIGNPAGFDGPHAFTLGETGIQIDLRSLTQEVKIIDAIHVLKPEIFFEMNSARSVNLNELKKYLEKTSPPKKTEAVKKEKKSGPEPKMIIRRILFSDGVVHVRIVPGGVRQYDLRMPAVEMTNLGGNTGATPDQITHQIIGELNRRAIREVEKKTVGAAVDKARDKAKELIQKGNWGGFLK